MVHVPYRGAAPALTDLIGGQVQVLFVAVPRPSSTSGPASCARSRSPRRRARRRCRTCPPLAISCRATRIATGAAWARPRTRLPTIIDTLNKEINAALADPKFKARLADLGGSVLAGSPADFGKLIADETEKWGKVIRAANIKPE